MNKPKLPQSVPSPYRPQAVPKCLQRKAAMPPQNAPSGRVVSAPSAPPAYRPQPTPKVLQKKSETLPAPPPAKHAPIAPPVYRPQPVPRVLQRTTALPGGNQSKCILPPASGSSRATGFGAGRGVAVIQRTLQHARIYSRVNGTEAKNKAEVEAQVRDTSLPEKYRNELLEAYNKGLSPQDQITLNPAATPAAPPVAKKEITEANYFQFWSDGEYGDPQTNADKHFVKHVRQQKEFEGRYGNVVEYTKGALEFAARAELLGDAQKGSNYGKYYYDARIKRGEMVVLNGTNGRLASYYELKGSEDDVAKYIQSKLGAASSREIVFSLRRIASTVAPLASSSPPPPSSSLPAPMVTDQTLSSPRPGAASPPTVDRYALRPPQPPPGSPPANP
jgi:hypothetical protein